MRMPMATARIEMVIVDAIEVNRSALSCFIMQSGSTMQKQIDITIARPDPPSKVLWKIYLRRGLPAVLSVILLPRGAKHTGARKGHPIDREGRQ